MGPTIGLWKLSGSKVRGIEISTELIKVLCTSQKTREIFAISNSGSFFSFGFDHEDVIIRYPKKINFCPISVPPVLQIFCSNNNISIKTTEYNLSLVSIPFKRKKVYELEQLLLIDPIQKFQEILKLDHKVWSYKNITDTFLTISDPILLIVNLLCENGLRFYDVSRHFFICTEYLDNINNNNFNREFVRIAHNSDTRQIASLDKEMNILIFQYHFFVDDDENEGLKKIQLKKVHEEKIKLENHSLMENIKNEHFEIHFVSSSGLFVAFDHFFFLIDIIIDSGGDWNIECLGQLNKKKFVRSVVVIDSSSSCFALVSDSKFSNWCHLMKFDLVKKSKKVLFDNQKLLFANNSPKLTSFSTSSSHNILCFSDCEPGLGGRSRIVLVEVKDDDDVTKKIIIIEEKVTFLRKIFTQKRNDFFLLVGGLEKLGLKYFLLEFDDDNDVDLVSEGILVPSEPPKSEEEYLHLKYPILNILYIPKNSREEEEEEETLIVVSGSQYATEVHFFQFEKFETMLESKTDNRDEIERFCMLKAEMNDIILNEKLVLKIRIKSKDSPLFSVLSVFKSLI